MSTVFINGKAALFDFLNGIRSEAIDTMDREDRNATSRMKRSLGVEVSEGIALTGLLSGLSHWRYVGNGRGPGKRPPAAPLRTWLLARGLVSESKATGAAFALSRRIGEIGTQDYRAGGINVFAKAIEAAQPKVDDLLQVFLRDVGNAELSQFNKAFAA